MMDTPYYVARTGHSLSWNIRRSSDGIICTLTDMLMAYRIVEALNREEAQAGEQKGKTLSGRRKK